jgi:hypothetical protein
MWPFTRKTGPVEPQLVHSPQHAADQLSFIPFTATSIELPSDGHVAVRGESHYQQALAIAVGGQIAGSDFDEHIPVRAALIPEPENPWDSHAVRVDVFVGNRTVTVGYLSQEMAPEYQSNLLTLRNKNMIGTCPGWVTGGGTKFYGIHLNLCYPEKLIIVTGDAHPMVSEQRDGYAVLRAEWSCTVTKEKIAPEYAGAVHSRYTGVFRQGPRGIERVHRDKRKISRLPGHRGSARRSTSRRTNPRDDRTISPDCQRSPRQRNETHVRGRGDDHEERPRSRVDDAHRSHGHTPHPCLTKH